MEIPKRMLECLKKIVCRAHAVFAGGSLKPRPLARENRQRGEPPLRMICRACAAEMPGFGRQNQSLQMVAMGPPTVPQLPHICARRFFVDVEIGCFEKTCCAEQQRLAVLNVFTQ